MTDYIILKGNEKLVAPKEFKSNAINIQEKKDSMIDKERRICIIQALMYLTIDEEDQYFKEYLDKQLLKDTKTVLFKFNEKGFDNELSVFHCEYIEVNISQISKKGKINKMPMVNPSPRKVIRLFVYIEIEDCSDLLIKRIEEFENEFANLIKNNYIAFLNKKSKTEAIVSATDKMTIFPIPFHIYSDAWDYEIPDISLRFDPNKFQNSLEIFKKEVKRSVNNKNIRFKIEQSEPNQDFSIILLHPNEAKMVLDSPLGILNPVIEDYVNGDVIEQEAFEDLYLKHGGIFEPEIKNLADSNEIVSDFKKNKDCYI